MASHLFSRPRTVKFALRNRLRRVLLESLERRDLMAVDVLGPGEIGSPVSYTIAGQSIANQPLAFQTSGDLSNLTPDQVTSYLDSTFGSTGGDITSRNWFPLIQESYSQWSNQNGLAFSFTSGFDDGMSGLKAEGEAGGPRLLSIAPNSGNIFSFNNVNTLTEAPTELVFRFDGSSGIDPTTIARGFKLIRAGRDGAFTDGNEQIITPGYLQFGDNNRIVVMRFATTLPDDLYRIMVIGVDNAGAGETAVRNTAGRTLDARLIDSTSSDLTRDSLDFKIELGAQVVAVVPQPADRLATSTVTLVQSGGSFVLRAHQGDITDNTAGTSVSLRLVQLSTATSTTAAYDRVANRITVTLAPAARISDITQAINRDLAPNFSIATVTNGAATVSALDLGIRTVSLNNWTLDVKRDQIRVYFNEDDLFGAAVKTGDITPNPSVVDPRYYQLILTMDTVQPNDDVIIPVTSIAYDPALNLATLTFADDIANIAGAGTFRLRIGGRDAVANVTNPSNVNPVVLGADQPGDFTNASSAGAPLPAVTLTNSTALTINQTIQTTSTTALPLDYPGSNFEPGHRDIQDETHINQPAGDSSPGIERRFYNFALNRPYGVDSQNRPVSTTITPEQIARVREIFEFYSMIMGIDFVESESSGITVVVGDMFPNGVQSGPGGVIGVAGNNLAIMDGAESWDNSFGGQSGIPGSLNFFLVSMHEIGHLLGYGHVSEQPVLTVMAGSALPFTEWAFPGDADVVHGQYMFRPDNRDVDSYKFVVPAGKSGTFTAETLAERLPNSSNLDTFLTLFKQTANGYEVVAVNNDSFSSDSFLSARLTEGTYFVSVTSKGNESFNPEIANTGDGGVSEGAYQLKVDFKEDGDAPTIMDLAGSALDGDGDGLAGGNFNFWFRAAPTVDQAPANTPKTIYVDKGYSGAAGAPDGTPARPLNSLDLSNPLRWPTGFLQSGDIVRVVGSQGADRRLNTSFDNPAYEFGRGGVGNAILSDGISLEVPQGVTVMIDAGAIFKLGSTRIAAGTLDASIEKSFASLQVLGTPRQTVNFTSYNDQTQGTDTNPLVTSPQAGDWGGIDFHNDIDRQEGNGDYERKGIFLNYVSHADIRYGGGQITVSSPSPTINPINMSEARPTLLYNTIRFSADAAMSADPNSFEETRFTEPRYQIAQNFRPDYDRVGPDIRGNLLTGNTVNGLFVRTVTVPGGPLTELKTSARWDDTDITYVLGENLIIAGTPGGSFLETTAPNVSLVQTISTASPGTLNGLTVRYKLTFIDVDGGQGIPSAATPALGPVVGNSVQLNNLPTATGSFVGRMLWRSTDGGNTYVLIAELDGDTTSYLDRGSNLSALLANPNATLSQRARLDARLQIDPGIVVKSTGARIEVGISAQLIAEGSADRKVIFTSRSDDRYGAGGTFDTNGNLSQTNPAAGDWGGLIARHLSSLSIDQALITFGGGQTSVSGGFAGFNAIEIHQADARVTNSIIENNASGLGGAVGASRDGRGPRDASVIYVVGSQPVIAENIIRNNSIGSTAVISINANSLNTDNVIDRGRQTGNADRIPGSLGNSGPLVDGNLLIGNGLNGMRVRGQQLTTASVWDDTDIVHVLESEVIVPDFHTYGGLRLQSKLGEGLVVKLGNGAGITATGEPLDIVDRIGGSLQIIGAPGFPVVLTSLSDDTVGAGFDPNGRPLLDTNSNGNATAPARGNWRSIRIQPYANDRNLDTIAEFEPDQIQDRGINDEANTAQGIGALATALNGGDENLRLGFTLHGAIAAPQDLDVYSFTGTAGTPVWIDIDQTNGALDTVVELIDANGAIIAQSNNSLQESLNPNLLFVDTTKILRERVQPLDQNPFAPRNSFQASATDLYSVNPLDAGMRVILPGTTGGANTYYIRVRSSNLKPNDPSTNLQNANLERGGLTTGAYRLQVRLQQNDEVAGSTVRYADIRFATNGIEVNGGPAHSPLLGQVGEQGFNGDATDTLVTGPLIQSLPGLGNIVNSDRGSVSVAGTLGNGANGIADIDLYSFSVNRDQTQSGSTTHISTVFDIDYADGIGRPDTTLWVYRIVNNNPVLVLVGTDSNIADDRSAPEQGSDLDSLGRGSVGSRDPFIGAAELPAGNYIVAVTNNSRIAAAMQQYQIANPINSSIRLEPVNSVDRLFVDRIGGSSQDTANGAPVLFPMTNLDGGVAQANAVPWTLADLTTYVIRNNGTGSQLVFGNTMTGVQEAEISNSVRFNDAIMSPDGRLVGYEINTTAANQTDANSGIFHLLNSIGAPGAAATPTGSTVLGNSGIQTFTTQRTNTTAPATFAIQPVDHNGPFVGGNNPEGDGFQFNDLTFFTEADDSATLLMFGVGSRGNATYETASIDPTNGNVTGTAGTVNTTTNWVFRLNPANGAAINPPGVADRTGAAIVNSGGPGTARVEYGRFNSTGTVTGLAEIGGFLFAVSNNGQFFRVNVGDASSAFGTVNPLPLAASGGFIRDYNNNPIAFTSLTAGPRNLENGRFANMLFGTTADGTIWAFNTNGIKQPIFPGFSASVRSSTAPLNPSPFLLDVVQGIDFSPLDVNLWHQTRRREANPGHGRPDPFDGSQGGNNIGGDNSLYFGYEANEQAGDWRGVYNVAAYEGTYNLPGGAHGAIISNPIDLRGYSADDLPMLYFNYFLATENANSDLEDGDIRMNDAFRVYAAGENGVWIQLTTNNSDQGGPDRNTALDEFDTAANLNVDPFGNPLFTQETFDNTGVWRQARTSLAALAGQENVRLRFEFSTGASFRTGDPQLGGVELMSVQAAKLSDGSNFVINPQDGVTAVAARTMEFDLGLVLNLPGGSSITSGVSQLILGATTLTFSTTSAGAGFISYQATDTPAQIATRVQAALIAAGFPAASIAVNSLRPNVLNVTGLTAATFSNATGLPTNYSVVGLPASVIEGLPGSEGAIVMQTVSALQLSSGRSSITINGNTLVFSTTQVGNGFINYTIFDSAATIAQRVVTALTNNTPIANAILASVNATRTDVVSNRNTVQIRGATSATIAFNTTVIPVDPFLANPATIISTPTGSTPNLPPVLISSFSDTTSTPVTTRRLNQSMTSEQVLLAIRTALAGTYTNPLQTTTGFDPLEAWPTNIRNVLANRYEGTSMRTFKFDLTNFSAVGITNGRNGDVLGVHGSNGNRMDERAQNNAFEGVYIDDIIVGFAERGEMVWGSSQADAIAAFTSNNQYAGLGNTFGLPQVELGAYQLTVRTAAEYGIQDGSNIGLARSFDTNARLAQQVGIQVSATAAGTIRDGITFTLSDGFNQSTFEFAVTVGAGDISAGVTPGNIPVPISANATPTEIATAIRNAINSPTAQLNLRITASLEGEMTFGSVFGDAAAAGGTLVQLHGDAAAIRTGNLTFANTAALSFVTSGNESPQFSPTGRDFGEDLGDVERQREQGQILLFGNTITDSSNFGIVSDAGARDQSAIGGTVGPRPYPGSPIQTPTPNQSNLAPGVVIMNNILANNTSGGLRLSGDNNVTGAVAPSLIARVLNNTIFAGTDGILVDEGASPTILNNIVANTTTGIRAVSSTVVLGANLYQNNGTNTVGTGGDGAFAEPLLPSENLFVSTTNRRFYLRAGSKAIDSSLEALQERPALTQVKNSIGLPLSPMLAPDLDVTGQRRVDDPTVNSPAGLGGNVFKDRGAVDRSDFLGLNAIILQPQDNDSALNDVDRNSTFIQLNEGEIEFFSILLQDTNGTGADEASVNAAGAVTLTENGRLLIPNQDYVFGYNANSRTIRLTPIAGIWRKDSVYEVTLNNRTGIQLSVGSGAAVVDGNRYTVNYPGGTAIFEFDKGTPAGVTAGAVPVAIQNGFTPYQVAAQLVAAINSVGLGLSAYLQGDGTLMVVGATSITATGAALGTPLTINAIRDLAGNPLNANRPTSLTQFTIIMPEVRLDFGDASGVNIPTLRVPNSATAPVVTNGDGARHAILPIDAPTLFLGNLADADADGVLSPSASGDDSETLVSLGSLGTAGATLAFRGETTLQINRAAIVDGQTFTLTDTIAHPLTPIVFELNTDLTPSGTGLPIFVAAGDNSGDVALKIANAIDALLKAGQLDGIIPIVDPAGSGRLRLVANDGYRVTIPVATTSVTQLANGNVDIVLPTSVAGLDGSQFSITDGNGSVVNFEINYFDPAVTPIPPVSANHVAINIPHTVAAPTTRTAVGTAIAAAINGQVALRNLLLGTVAANAGTISLQLDDEDGVRFNGVLNAEANPITVSVTSSGAGMLDAWVDWNGDGDFSDFGEQFIVNRPVQAGVNSFTLDTPVGATVGFVMSRFRVSPLGSSLASGIAIGGEVEDYIVEIIDGAPPVAVADRYTTDEDVVFDSLIGNLSAAALSGQNQITLPSVSRLAVGNGVIIREGAGAQILTVTAITGTTVTLSANLTQNYTTAATVSFTVLGNDTDPNNDPLAIPPIVEPIFVFDENPNTPAIDPLDNVDNGTLVLNADGTFIYTPNLDFNGTDFFVYNAVDQRLKSNTPTTVTITVNRINDVPLAMNDTIGQANGMFEDRTIVLPGSFFTSNDRAHFALGTSANAVNESGQLLTLVDGGATIVSETTTNFGGVAGVSLQVAAKPGQGAYGIRLYINSSDLGAGGLPVVSVVQSTISVTINSNATTPTTITQLINAINASPTASALVNLTLTGAGSTVIGTLPTTYAPVVVPPSGGTVSVSGNVFTYTPPLHYNNNIGGPAIVRLTIQDDATAGPVANLTSTATVTINITPVNDRPEYDAWPANKQVITVEDVGPVSVPQFIQGLRPGPAEAVDEAGGPVLGGAVPPAPENQILTFTNILPSQILVEALRPELFATRPSLTIVGTDATLNFELLPDVNREAPFGPILVRVTLQDSGLVGGPNNDLNRSVTRTFTILPAPRNDAPVFDLANAVVPVDEDQGTVTIAGFMRNQFPAHAGALDELAAGANPAQMPMRVEIAADPNVFAVMPTIDPVSGDLTFRTRPNVNRLMPGLNFNVSVTLIDSAGTVTENGGAPGVDRTTKVFAVDIQQFNDPPEFVFATSPTYTPEVPEAAPGVLNVVERFIRNITPGPATATDEVGQVVRFQVDAIDSTGAINTSLFEPGGLPLITVVTDPVTGERYGNLSYRLRTDVNQVSPPFARILVRAFAFDDGVPSPTIVQFDPLITTPRNVNATASATFTITPAPRNDAPIFTFNPLRLSQTAPPTVMSQEDQGLVTVNDFLLDVLPGPLTALDELANQEIIQPILVEALDPSAFDGPTGQPRLVLNIATRRATLTYRTAPNVNSQTGHNLNVRFTLQDNGGTTNPEDVDRTVATFAIRVNPVNDAPSFTLPTPAEVTVFEDNETWTGISPTSIDFATNMVAGPATAVDETTLPPTRQTWVFDTISYTRPELFVGQPTIAPDGKLIFTTAANQNGQSVVVVRMRDLGPNVAANNDVNISAPQTFTINITAVNDAPQFTIPLSTNSREDQGLVTVPLFATNLLPGPVVPGDENSQQLTFHVRALDPSAFEQQPDIAADGTLTYRVARDVNSNTPGKNLRVEVFVTDGGANSTTGLTPDTNRSETKVFTINVTPVNDAPVFTLTTTEVNVIEDVEQFNNVPITSIPGFANPVAEAAGLTNLPPLLPTATDEVSQTLTFRVLSVTAPELFEIQPAISDTGVLTFKTAAHKNGKAIVIIQLEDNGDATPAPNDRDSDRQTFTISISPINDAPSFQVPPSVTVAEDFGFFSLNGFASQVRRGPVGSDDENSQTVEFELEPLSPSGVFATAPQIGPDGTLTFETALNVNRDNADLRVRVRLRDNGDDTPPPNSRFSAWQTFTIDATPVNDPPIANAYSVNVREQEQKRILSADVLDGDVGGPTPDEADPNMTITQVERTTARGGIVVPQFAPNGIDIVSFDYTPPADLVGTDSFLYVVTDKGTPRRSGTGTIMISIEGINDAPVFQRGVDVVAPEDSNTVTINNWATGIFAGPPAAIDELNSQTVSFEVNASNRSLFADEPTITPEGTLSFRPAKDANGVSIVRVVAVDSGSGVAPNVNRSAEQIFTITINAVNDPPVFTPGANFSVNEDSAPYSQPWASNIAPAAGLLLNPQTALDEGNPPQPVDFTISVNNPSLFSVQPTINSNGLLQFTLTRDAFGTALLTIRAVDRGPSGAQDQNTSAPHVLTITINPSNDAPIAVSDTFNTNENTTLTINAPGLLGNDTDVDGNQLTAIAGSLLSARGAAVTINANGSIVYDPSAVASLQQLSTGANAVDTFVYRVTDGTVQSAEATVTINVAGVNDAPVAVNDSFNVALGQSQLLDVLLNDFDVDSSIDSASIVITSLPAFGSVIVNQTGVVQYTPGGGFRGNDSFRYTVRDTAGNTSNEATVSILVNSRPTANDDAATTVKNTPITINVLSNDVDTDGTLVPSTVQIIAPPSSGTATVDLANGTIQFVPAPDFFGSTTLTYVVSDNSGTGSNAANVNIRVLRSRWQNPRNSLDVNNDTFISPIDALLIINRLNNPNFNRNLNISNPSVPPFIDTSGDEVLSPLDALLVINRLNAMRGGSGEGEGELRAEGELSFAAPSYAMMVTPQQMLETVGVQVVQEVQSQLASALSTPSNASSSATSPAFIGWVSDEEEDDVEGLFCSADEEFDSVVDAVDQFFESIGPYMPE